MRWMFWALARDKASAWYKKSSDLLGTVCAVPAFAGADSLAPVVPRHLPLSEHGLAVFVNKYRHYHNLMFCVSSCFYSDCVWAACLVCNLSCEPPLGFGPTLLWMSESAVQYSTHHATRVPRRWGRQSLTRRVPQYKTSLLLLCVSTRSCRVAQPLLWWELHYWKFF